MELAVQSCLAVLQNPEQGFDNRLDSARSLVLRLRSTLAALNGQPRPSNAPLLTWSNQQMLERFLNSFSGLIADKYSVFLLWFSFT